MSRTPSPKSTNARRAGLLALFAALLRRLRDDRGAATLEHVLVMSVALTGAVGFKELGTQLQSQLEREGDHIEGKGMPRNGDLGGLAASFEKPELGCPSGLCSAPSLSLPSGVDGVTLSSPALPSLGTKGPKGAAPALGSGPLGSAPAGVASLVSGATNATGASGLPPTGASVPLPLTPEQRDAQAECEKRLAASPQTFTKLKKQSGKKRDRPKSRRKAVQRLCLEMVCECSEDHSTDECIDEWECIFGLVAQSPTTQYFDRMNVGAGDDQCPDPRTQTNDNRYIRDECVDKRIKRWACDKQPVVDDHGRPYPGIKATTLQNPDRDGLVSKAAGEEAARNFASANFGTYDCVEEDTNNVFDLLCIQDGHVVIIEAKGGDAVIDKRMDATRKMYVQQGTKEYALAIAAEMEAKAGRMRRDHPNDPAVLAAADKLETRAATVAQEVDANGARYFKVSQPFDDKGRPLDPVLSEFDLAHPDTVCRNCNCGGRTSRTRTNATP